MPDIKQYLHTVDLVNNKITNLLLNPLTTAQRTTLAGILTALDEGYLAYDTTVSSFYYWDGTTWQQVGGVANWGTITGTITAQTDLINYLIAPKFRKMGLSKFLLKLGLKKINNYKKDIKIFAKVKKNNIRSIISLHSAKFVIYQEKKDYIKMIFKK